MDRENKNRMLMSMIETAQSRSLYRGINQGPAEHCSQHSIQNILLLVGQLAHKQLHNQRVLSGFPGCRRDVPSPDKHTSNLELLV